MNARRYLHGWRMWLRAVGMARRKKHGAGRMPLRNALKMAACYRHIVDGQWCDPPRFPRWMRRGARAPRYLREGPPP